jgi:hypothetical protein
MKLVIEIDMDNDEFVKNPRHAVTRALNDVKHNLQFDGHNESVKIRDENSNTVDTAVVIR